MFDNRLDLRWIIAVSEGGKREQQGRAYESKTGEYFHGKILRVGGIECKAGNFFAFCSRDDSDLCRALI